MSILLMLSVNLPSGSIEKLNPFFSNILTLSISTSSSVGVRNNGFGLLWSLKSSFKYLTIQLNILIRKLLQQDEIY